MSQSRANQTCRGGTECTSRIQLPKEQQMYLQRQSHVKERKRSCDDYSKQHLFKGLVLWAVLSLIHVKEILEDQQSNSPYWSLTFRMAQVGGVSHILTNVLRQFSSQSLLRSNTFTSNVPRSTNQSANHSKHIVLVTASTKWVLPYWISNHAPSLTV